MEKTSLETQFDRLMINHICSLNISPHSRAQILFDFHENSSAYYENLCDILFSVSTHAVRAPIWMNHSGEIYASTHKKNKNDIFLLSSSEVPDFEGDIVVQIEYIFLCIYRISSRNFKKCSDNVPAMS